MQNTPFKTLQLSAGKTLFKKTDFFNHFYQLIEGELDITIGTYTISISQRMIFGDYEILESLDYRASTVKTTTKCVIRMYEVDSYKKMRLYFKEFQRGFDKFNFRNKTLKYWIKKLFFVLHLQKFDSFGKEASIGVVLEGSFKIERAIPIVKMKSKNMEVMKQFQICSMGVGQIFKGALICESNSGTIGLCSQKNIKILLDRFEEFKKVVEMANFKGEVHNSLEKDIARNCSKKAKLFRNLVPLPLKQHIKPESREDSQVLLPEIKDQIQMSSQRHTVDVFEVKDSIADFLHKQLRKELKIFLKRKGDVSPSSHSHSKSNSSSNKKSARSKLSPTKKHPKIHELASIKNPVLINLQNYRSMKKRKKRQLIQEKIEKESVLPQVKSIRIKTEGNEKSQRMNHYFKLLNFQQN